MLYCPFGSNELEARLDCDPAKCLARKIVPLKWQECVLWENSKGCKMPK
jgi:hypothetical protein